MRAIDAVTMECCGEAVEPRAAVLTDKHRDFVAHYAVWHCVTCAEVFVDHEHCAKAQDAWDVREYPGGDLFAKSIINALRDSQRPDTGGR